MINNFNQIRSLLSFKDGGDFYFIQIIKRKKDNPNLPSSESLIKSYSVYSLEEYDKLESTIDIKCRLHNARAYIRLNKRNSKDIALHMIKELTDAVINNNSNHLHKIYESVTGKYSVGDKTWIIDVDGTSELAFKVIEYLHHLTGQDETRILFRVMIPTVNGYHIICKPFDSREFKTKYPAIDIHKENPTLLFADLIK